MNQTFPATLNKLHEMLAFIHDQAIITGFDENQASRIEVALEEALVNIINYAYPDKTESLSIDCKVESTPKSLTIILKDHGKPFDPLKNGPAIKSDIPIDDKPVGGYGIFMMRQIMDQVTYEYLNHENVLTLVKHL